MDQQGMQCQEAALQVITWTHGLYGMLNGVITLSGHFSLRQPS